MGCHTHVCKRLRYTREQLIAFAHEEQRYQQGNQKKYPHWFTQGEKLTAGDSETLNEFIVRYLERVRHGNTEPGFDRTQVSLKTGFAYECGSLDFFRVRSYPEIELHSIHETLQYMAGLQRAGENLEEDENTMPILEDFWRANPGGMIVFY